MSMEYMKWIQERLLVHDFDPGIVDGIWGRRTRNALIAFQISVGISADGKTNNETMAFLRASPAWSSSGPSGAKLKITLFDRLPWMALAVRKKGLHEGKDNSDLSKFLKEDGKTLGDPSTLPWCGDFVETCIALALPDAELPTNPYLARNWQRFGQAVEPCFGSVLVFWRGSLSGTKGHVGFYYSETENEFQVLGGNQSNAVTIRSIDKGRLLSAQLPNVGGPYPRKKVTSGSDFELSENEA